MIYRIIIALLILFSDPLSITAQGLLLDGVISKDQEVLERTRADQIPKIASLKAYAPHVMMQQNSTCVAYSVAAARTMLFARNYDITSKDTITALYYSPHWVYYSNKDSYDFSCSSGLNLDKTLKHLLSNGIPRMMFVEYPEYYPFTVDVLCGSYPPTKVEDIENAKQNGVDNVYKLENIEDVKIALSRGMPVVFGMAVNEHFEDLLDQDVWLPTESTKELQQYGHAMVIVGYNDYKYGGSVEVLNSWGTEWGNNGYVWIRYADLLDYISKFVFAIDKNKESKFGSSVQSNELHSPSTLSKIDKSETVNIFSRVSDLTKELKARNN